MVLATPFAFVTVVDDTRSFWKSCIGVESTDIADRQNSVQESFCQYVIGLGESLVVGDTANHPLTCDNPSIGSMGVRAWAGFPLRAPGGEVLGTFCVVDTKIRSWTEPEVEVLETLAHAAAGEIALREIAATASAFAATLQSSLLPHAMPSIPGADLAARYLPANDGFGVLGDFFDAFEIGDAWVLVIGDVCGHGVQAARTTLLARWTLRAVAQRNAHPGEMLDALDAELLRRAGDDEPFLTAQVIVLRVAGDGSVNFGIANGGHPHPLVLRRSGEVEVVEVPGGILGTMATEPRPSLVGTLAPGELVMLYTDGLSEARDGGRFFGDAALADCLVNAGGGSAADVADEVVGAATAFTQGRIVDDIAVVVLRGTTPGSLAAIQQT
jgi:serine phosphatase RsbU (regulator of sigma subunit)